MGHKKRTYDEKQGERREHVAQDPQPLSLAVTNQAVSTRGLTGRNQPLSLRTTARPLRPPQSMRDQQRAGEERPSLEGPLLSPSDKANFRYLEGPMDQHRLLHCGHSAAAKSNPQQDVTKAK